MLVEVAPHYQKEVWAPVRVVPRLGAGLGLVGAYQLPGRLGLNSYRRGTPLAVIVAAYQMPTTTLSTTSIRSTYWTSRCVTGMLQLTCLVETSSKPVHVPSGLVTQTS